MIWSAAHGIDLFVEVYDWDRVVLDSAASIPLSRQINLCAGIYPCSISLIGPGSIRLMESGAISCLANTGCVALSIFSLQFACESERSLTTVLSIESSDLLIYNSSFFACYTDSDGGIVQSLGNSSVEIESSIFTNISSYGSGGAISAVGGIVTISSSQFINCSSLTGGGAISASAFSCAGAFSNQIIGTIFDIEECKFIGCSSEEQGGAIQVTGESVSMNVAGSEFLECASKTTGGALSVNNGGTIVLTNCLFLNNSAAGLGGGALHSNSAGLTLRGIVCNQNKAVNGGGGALFWSGGMEPVSIVPWCRVGFFTDSAAIPGCLPCKAGTYQSSEGETACSVCVAGKYSTAIGATASATCVSCEAGKFSMSVKSSSVAVCILCGPGTFSYAGSESCPQCEAGSYSVMAGANSSQSCLVCNAGTFSTANGASSSASCILCGAGTFTNLGARNCTECRAGTYSTAIGATSPKDCIDCKPGEFSITPGLETQVDCLQCSKGKYTGKKYFTYEMVALRWNDAEAACAANGGHLASIESEAENLEVLNLLPAFHDFWIGYHYDQANGSWTWSDGSKSKYSSWGESNPKAGSDVFNCAEFPSYGYTTANTSGLLALWPYFSEAYDISIDTDILVLDPGTWYNFDCGNAFGWVVGYVCSFTGSTSCYDCKAGTYSATIGATSIESCMTCPPGTFSHQAGASACTVSPETGTGDKDQDSIPFQSKERSAHFAKHQTT